MLQDLIFHMETMRSSGEGLKTPQPQRKVWSAGSSTVRYKRTGDPFERF